MDDTGRREPVDPATSRRRSWKKILIIASAVVVSWGVKLALFGGAGYLLVASLFHLR